MQSLGGNKVKIGSGGGLFGGVGGKENGFSWNAGLMPARGDKAAGKGGFTFLGGGDSNDNKDNGDGGRKRAAVDDDDSGSGDDGE